MITNPAGAVHDGIVIGSSMLNFSRRIAKGISVDILKEEDADALFTLVDANRAHLRCWLPWLDAIRSPAEKLAFIQAMRKLAADNIGFSAAIRVETEIAGVAVYRTVDSVNRSGSVGYWLAEPYQGRGLATRACQALIDFAFAALNMNRVGIACAVENTRSRAIPQRLGFQHEGFSRDAEWLYTHYVTHANYSLLQREWRAAILANPQRLIPSNIEGAGP